MRRGTIEQSSRNHVHLVGIVQAWTALSAVELGSAIPHGEGLAPHIT